ncbi:LLM class flavin-dependent oxidoreductase [Sciscionella marina]|uniref:LLM class flavin-dependent oxidoreductase n=1 Tax=Sciscionella marina TaxID=508770 RepID=UPI0012F6C4B9|nr:LLM class flavin-dependent oxidoreductase [Sciscionella marina]
MKFGFMELPRSMAETTELAKHADEAGYTWMGIADTPTVFQESYLHQMEALRNSRRLLVGPLATHVVVRHPLIVGNLLATLHETSGGRAIGAVATGNSAARGLGLRPATVDELGEAVAAIRGYWAGNGGAFDSRTFPGSTIPVTGISRRGCPLLVAADGPRVTALGGEVGDGVLYGGTMAPEVLARRVETGRISSGQHFWVGPGVSLAETVDAVLDDMGALLVAMANRAFRGDLTERGIPAARQHDVRLMWEHYDYGSHADNTRPRNTTVVSRELAEYLVRNFVVWGQVQEWAQRLDELERHGCDGVMFILGQGDQLRALRGITDRLRELGRL